MLSMLPFAASRFRKSPWLYKKTGRGGGDRTPDAIFPAPDIPYIMRHRYGRDRDEFYVPRKNDQKIPAIFLNLTHYNMLVII